MLPKYLHDMTKYGTIIIYVNYGGFKLDEGK